MTGGGDVDLYRELVETKIENGLNEIRSHNERLSQEARKDTDADLKVIKDECDQIQIAIEKLSGQMTEMMTGFKSFRDNLPNAIDEHLEQRRKSTMTHLWDFCRAIFNYLPQVLAAVVSIIIIWAWLTGKLSAIDAATGIGL